jgi:glutamine synthetase
MNIEALRDAVRMQEIDTVIVAMTDMQGRLQGKRFHARFFLDEVAAHGTEACAYLLAVDTDMNTVDGYALTSWETGYGDFALVPDLATLRIAVAWGPDNRTCALRLVGHGPSLRVECRVPGGDVNPYLALAGLAAAALSGAAWSLPLPEPVTGNAYAVPGLPRVPASLEEALELWSSSELAAEAFGADVVDQYATMARVELDAYRRAVTDWELRRYFERI